MTMSTTPPGSLDQRVDAVRRFNRFYTRHVGALDAGLLQSPFTLTEARVLYELAHRTRPSATELIDALAIDAGYLSRIVRRFERRRLLTRDESPDDRRRSALRLTAAGRRAFAHLEARTRTDISKKLSALSDGDQRRLVSAMGQVAGVLTGPDSARAPFVLRSPQPGDMGWVVSRHGELYSREYGWDWRFEAFVARIVADFVDHFDAKGERCWIAERDGERCGCVFLVRQSRRVAKLRLLLVDPAARGSGLGTTLVEECVRFARQAGYRKIVLWTNDVLDSARRIYERAGFTRTSRHRHNSFGVRLTGETWELALSPLALSPLALSP